MSVDTDVSATVLALPSPRPNHVPTLAPQRATSTLEDGRRRLAAHAARRVEGIDAEDLVQDAAEGGVSNLCFGGEDGRTLLLLSETKAYAVQMRVRGALI